MLFPYLTTAPFPNFCKKSSRILLEATKDNPVCSRLTCSSWCTIAINVEAVGAGNKSICPLSVTRHRSTSSTCSHGVSIFRCFSGRNDGIVAVHCPVERVTCRSGPTVAINVVAVIASDKTVCSHTVTGYCTFRGTRADVLAVCDWCCSDCSNKGS